MFENNLKKRREQLKMSVDEIAKAAEVSPAFIYAVEAGVKKPSIPTAGLIAKAVRSTVDEIFLPGLSTNGRGRRKTT